MILIRSLLITLVSLLGACASLPPNNQQASYQLHNTENSILAINKSKLKDEHQANDEHTGLMLLGNSDNALVARLALARLAEYSLDVQYYLFHDDLSGRLLIRELLRAADRGVRVRILVDDMAVWGRDHSLAVISAHKNIELRTFNPFVREQLRLTQFVTGLGSVTRRMHNKSFTADNQLSIIGGRNIGDEYFGADAELYFGDLDVMMTNPAAKQVSTEFDLYWNHPLAYPTEILIAEQPSQVELAEMAANLEAFFVEQEQQENKYLVRLKNSGFLSRLESGQAEYYLGKAVVLYDDPDKISSNRDAQSLNLTPKLVAYLSAVDTELVVISPYFIPGKVGVQFFSQLVKRGVTVRILTNSLMSNDVPIVHSGYVKYRKKLLKAGVKLYEIDKALLEKNWVRQKNQFPRDGTGSSKSSLHAKYFILDREKAFIGSLNLDPRSVTENTEIGVVLDAPKLAAELAKDFDEFIQQIAFEVKLQDGDVQWHGRERDGTPKTFHEEPYSTWWDRFSIGVMKWLPVESQL